MKLAFTVATPDTHDPNMLAFRGDLEHAFRTLAEIGYEGVELMVRNPVELSVKGVRTLSKRYSLSIPAVSTGQLRKEDNLSLNSLDPAERAVAIQRTREVIDFAAEFGAQVNIGTLRGQMPGGPGRSEAMEAVRDSLAQLLAYAHDKRVRLALEPQCRFVSNWLNTVDETRTFVESFGTLHPWILFDVYHALLEECSIVAAMIRVQPLLTWVQFSDSNRLVPGAGQLNFAEYMRVLHALEFNGYISVECTTQPDAASTARRAYRHLQPLLRDRDPVAN